MKTYLLLALFVSSVLSVTYSGSRIVSGTTPNYYQINFESGPFQLDYNVSLISGSSGSIYLVDYNNYNLLTSGQTFNYDIFGSTPSFTTTASKSYAVTGSGLWYLTIVNENTLPINVAYYANFTFEPIDIDSGVLKAAVGLAGAALIASIVAPIVGCLCCVGCIVLIVVLVSKRKH
eukprot:TRINITY_DN1107_c0_g1_i2.p1 TRINITY_DN1107_c0_g1~~TRINITY_DN1107_c0_g1_i2.p1  ORF type:complete len:195 (-),score=41.76 TRINITY_DN1107_c0_g1_i2:58-585(-)